MKNYKISIPEPCHENWKEMTSVEKGRFCKSCAKTVIDFTKKSPEQIQEYLQQNQGKRVCGHFYKKQLNSIVVELPNTIFERELSFQKMFILIVLVVMGTSLLSCKTEGKTQKIEKIIVKDSIVTIGKIKDTLSSTNVQDTVKKELPVINEISRENEIETVVGKLPIASETTGIILFQDNNEDKEKSEVIEVIEYTGELTIEEINKPEYFLIVEKVPRFKGINRRTNESWEDNFERKIKEFVNENFDYNSTLNLGLAKGKKKIYSQFVIGVSGFIEDIKVKAPHPKLKEEVESMLKKLPQFIPGEKGNRQVRVKYNLPISFVVE